MAVRCEWRLGDKGVLACITSHVLSFPQLWVWFVASRLILLAFLQIPRLIVQKRPPRLYYLLLLPLASFDLLQACNTDASPLYLSIKRLPSTAARPGDGPGLANEKWMQNVSPSPAATCKQWMASFHLPELPPPPMSENMGDEEGGRERDRRTKPHLKPEHKWKN